MDGFGLFGMTGEEIYRNFTEAAGAGDLAAASDLWRELQEEHEEEARRIRELAVRMESAWRGDAAGAAQRGAIPLAVEHESSAPLLFTDHDLFGRQVGSFNDARNRVVPVPPAPDRPSGFEILFSPQALPTYEGKLAEYNTAAQHNVDVMDGYEGASSYNGENLPSSYGSLQPDSAGIGVAPESSRPNEGGPPPDDGRRTPVEGNWLPHPGSSGPRPGPGPSAEPSGPSPGASGGSPPQDTTPGGLVPTPAEVPSTRPVLPGGGPGLPGGGGPPQVGELVPVGGWSGGGGPPGGPGGGAPGGAGGRLGGEPGGARLGGEPGGGRAGGESGHGPGGRAGAGPVAGGAAAEAAARGTAGARGVGGAGLPVGVGVGRGQGADDIERKAPDYLEEPDPEGLFGADVLTAPPVIGAEEEERG